METSKHIHRVIGDYYSDKVRAHGATHLGVDWNSTESQELRFSKFLFLFQNTTYFSVNDYGCGYGALYTFLSGQNITLEYHGFDVSEAMIEQAHNVIKDQQLFVGSSPKEKTDFSVGSGIFNVRQEIDDPAWYDHIINTIHNMDHHSHKGFAFNCLTGYSDEEYKKDYLYYADSCQLFDYCKRHFSRNVALLHDYDLYEFTIIVRKNHDT